MSKQSARIRDYALGVVIILVLVSPIALYFNQFGGSLSTVHARWAEFGSFLTGIYSPMIAFLALMILVTQNLNRSEFEKHQIDREYVENSLRDINDYLRRLEHYLGQVQNTDGRSVDEILNSNFSGLTIEELKGSEGEKHSDHFYSAFRVVCDTWRAIYTIWTGLNTVKEYPYVGALTASQLKVITTLSYGTCVSLDKLLFASTPRMVKTESLFFLMEYHSEKSQVQAEQ